MNKQELKEFSAVCQEVKDIKTNYQKIEENLKEINRKLDNHITHIEGNISTIQTNIDWLIKTKNENTNFKGDEVQNTNISWITRLLFLGIGIVVAMITKILTDIISK
jgi:esterase/lipase